MIRFDVAMLKSGMIRHIRIVAIEQDEISGSHARASMSLPSLPRSLNRAKDGDVGVRDMELSGMPGRENSSDRKLNSNWVIS